jgi:hypothetical protein
LSESVNRLTVNRPTTVIVGAQSPNVTVTELADAVVASANDVSPL